MFQFRAVLQVEVDDISTIRGRTINKYNLNICDKEVTGCDSGTRVDILLVYIVLFNKYIYFYFDN